MREIVVWSLISMGCVSCSGSSTSSSDSAGSGGATNAGAGGAVSTDAGWSMDVGAGSAGAAIGAGGALGGSAGALPGSGGVSAGALPGSGGDSASGVDGRATADAAADSSGSADAPTACSAVADAICAKGQTCGPFAISAVYGDVATCRNRVAQGCLSTIGAPSSSATAMSTTACAQSIAALSCNTVSRGDFGAACRAVPGALTLGAACGDDSQCASTFCARAGDAICGICAAPTAAGDPCVRGSCSAGTVCPAGQSTCITPVPGQVGAACTALEQCDLGHMVGCNTLSGRCIALTLAQAGGACGANSIVPTSYAVCPASGTCSAAIGGTCSAAAADGATCSTTTSPGCMSPARCVGGRCTLPAPASCM
jgi:hypothetical protein